MALIDDILFGLGGAATGALQGLQVGSAIKERRADRESYDRNRDEDRRERERERVFGNIRRAAEAERAASRDEATRTALRAILERTAGGREMLGGLGTDVPTEVLERVLPIATRRDPAATPRNIDPLSEEGRASRVALERALSGIPRRPGADDADGSGPLSLTSTEATRREALLRRLAEGAIEAANGDEQAAIQRLVSDPATRDVFSQGMGSRHIQSAAQRFRERPAVRNQKQQPSFVAQRVEQALGRKPGTDSAGGTAAAVTPARGPDPTGNVTLPPAPAPAPAAAPQATPTLPGVTADRLPGDVVQRAVDEEVRQAEEAIAQGADRAAVMRMLDAEIKRIHAAAGVPVGVPK